jgi:chemotaxis methyl-accepting protein methylase
MNANLLTMAEFMRRETGITVKPLQLPSLEAAMRRVEPTMTVDAFVSAITDRGTGAPLLERMIDEFTIKETFFFRQRLELDAIDWRSLVEQARASGSPVARVWVAATASGEEAYTLAILASEAFAPNPPPVLIHATDISPSALARAQRGRYGKRSARALEQTVLDRYFTHAGPDVVVGERLRGVVRFSRQNLVGRCTPAAGGPFDLITCRNVLIYFEPDVADRVVDGLTQALDPAGRLLLGAADRLCCSAARLLGPTRSGAAAPPANQRSAAPSAHQRPAAAQTLRRPLGREPREPPLAPAAGPAAELSIDLDDALRAANQGDLEAALGATARALNRDALDPKAHFLRGLALRGVGRHAEAISAFRSALYVDPGFGLAAFEMGRALEACGDETSAARSYNQALKTFDRTPDSVLTYSQLHSGDVAAACAIRLLALSKPVPTRQARGMP